MEEDQQLAELLRQEGEETYVNRLVVKEVESELSEIGDLLSREDANVYSLERFETLWHLAAEIGVRIRDDIALTDIFSAIFPPVSVTGVPKVEAMALVTATEDTPRGVYCGAIGFIEPAVDGRCDASFSVAVRTVVIDEDEGVAEFGVGAAITTRSEAVTAYEEARLKAKILVDRRPEFTLFEEFRCDEGVIGFADEKIDRLAASAQYFGYEVDPAAVTKTLRSHLASESPVVVKVMLDRNGGVRSEVGPAPQWHARPDTARPLQGEFEVAAVSTENVYLFHNTTNARFLDTVMRQHPGAQIVLYSNEMDDVAGATVGNVAARIGGKWVTPPAGSGNVPAGYRNHLVAQGVVTERPFSHQDLLAASEVSVIDDIHGWRAVQLPE